MKAKTIQLDNTELGTKIFVLTQGTLVISVWNNITDANIEAERLTNLGEYNVTVSPRDMNSNHVPADIRRRISLRSENQRSENQTNQQATREQLDSTFLAQSQAPTIETRTSETQASEARQARQARQARFPWSIDWRDEARQQREQLRIELQVTEVARTLEQTTNQTQTERTLQTARHARRIAREQAREQASRGETTSYR